MATVVYQHPKCSTCKKALSFLDKKGVDYKIVDITQKAPKKSELKKMLGLVDGQVRKLFNTSGMQYRELKLSEKVPSMSENEAIDLLSSNGMLVKRPFVLTEGQGLVGFREAAWKEVF